MSNVGSSTTYAGTGETTEWEDILHKRGIVTSSKIVEREEEAKREAALADAIDRKQAAYDPLAHKTLTELDELAEADEFADSHALESYRKKRVEELKSLAARNKFGRVYPLSRDDFVREVTEGSKDSWVVVLLYKDGIPHSAHLSDMVNALAAKHKAVKFMRIVADKCIEDYPDRNVPTLLLYHDGVCQEQVVGMGQYGPTPVNSNCVEWVLSRKGVLETELEEDPRGRGGSEFRSAASGARVARYADDDDDE